MKYLYTTVNKCVMEKKDIHSAGHQTKWENQWQLND
jgi:hypothetical protein